MTYKKNVPAGFQAFTASVSHTTVFRVITQCAQFNYQMTKETSSPEKSLQTYCPTRCNNPEGWYLKVCPIYSESQMHSVTES